MELINPASLLRKAQREHYAVGAFNVSCAAEMKACIDAAEEMRAPIIIQLYHETVNFLGPQKFAGVIRALTSDAGVPIALKDLIDEQGSVTTCGSDFYRHRPGESATVVQRLEKAGAVIIGRTGLHEFAFGFSSENHWFGPVRNPWDPATSPGGSSGGSAVAVADGLATIGVGTDTGGSIRQPAHFCGIA